MQPDQKDPALRAEAEDAQTNSSPRPDDGSAQSGEGRDRATENAGYNQHGHGKGGKLGEGEPDGKAERDGTTQPNFGQAGSWGKSTDPKQ